MRECLVVGLTCEHRVFVDAIAGSKGTVHEKKKAIGLDILFQVNPEALKFQCCLSLALLEDGGAS